MFAYTCVQAVYGLLKEAEHRSTFYIPYWDLPLARCAGIASASACLNIVMMCFSQLVVCPGQPAAARALPHPVQDSNVRHT